MSIGQSVLSLLGRKDPREAVLQAVINDGTGAQYAAAPAAAPATSTPADPAGGTPAPQPQVAQAYQSPPDLANMYKELTKYNSAETNINRGFGLIGSAISQDANRRDTLLAFTGDRSNQDDIGVANIADLAMKMKANNINMQKRAAMLASLPSLAARYGISLDAARAMYEGGQLEEFIKEQEKPDRTTMADGEGRLQTIDQRKGAGIGSPVGPAKPIYEAGPDGSKYLMVPGQEPKQLIAPSQSTNDTKNYDAYVNDEIVRNTEPAKILSFNDWNLQQNKSKAQSTTIKAETAEASKIGDYRGEQYKKTMDGALAAQDNLNNYSLLEKGLDTGIRTGAFGDAEQSLRKMSQALGLSEEGDDKIAGGELIDKINGRLMLAMRNPDSGMGMPGSLSDKDMAFLKNTNLGLGTSGPGNRLTLAVLRRMEDRKIEKAEAMDDWMSKHDNSTLGFNKYWRDYVKSNPLFDDINVADFVDKPAGGGTIDPLVEKYRTKK